MDANKLAKQLKKELTRNYKKTAALGIVTLVALWFWSPLVVKYFGGKPSKKAQAVAAAAEAEKVGAAAATPAATETSAPDPAAKVLDIGWEHVLHCIGNDHNMRTAAIAPQARDPFDRTETEAKAIVDAPAPVANTGSQPATRPLTASQATPASLGLVLEATMISRSARRATISGQTYLEGDLLQITLPPPPGAPAPAAGSKKIPAPTIDFVLTQVDVRRAVLTRGGQPYELIIERDASDSEQLTLAPNPQAPAQ